MENDGDFSLYRKRARVQGGEGESDMDGREKNFYLFYIVNAARMEKRVRVEIFVVDVSEGADRAN